MMKTPVFWEITWWREVNGYADPYQSTGRNILKHLKLQRHSPSMMRTNQSVVTVVTQFRHINRCTVTVNTNNFKFLNSDGSDYENDCPLSCDVMY